MEISDKRLLFMWFHLFNYIYIKVQVDVHILIMLNITLSWLYSMIMTINVILLYYQLFDLYGHDLFVYSTFLICSV